MRVRNLIPANNIDELNNIILAGHSNRVRQEVMIALEVMPVDKTYVGQVYISGIDYVRVHHIKTGSIVIIEKDAPISDGCIFIDQDRFVKQFVTEKPNHRVVSFSTEVERYTYKTVENAENAWGVIRLAISPE